MSGSDPVDPQLLPFLDLFPPMIYDAERLAETRETILAMFEQAPLPDLPVETHEISVPGPDGAPEIGIEISRPRDASGSLPAILHIHGGGYVVGRPMMSRARNRQFAHDLGCLVLSVDYRLSPETAFPGGLEDCYAALAWLYDKAEELGIDRQRIAIMGESAGGGLAAALAQVARDRGKVPLVLQVLVYPMLDDRTLASPIDPHSGEKVWNAAFNRFGWTSYLGHEPGTQETAPYAAPGRTEDLAGLPPAYLVVGQLDLFLQEDVDYARRLMAAGVPTELHVYPGAFHGFDNWPDAWSAKATMASLTDALARAFSRRI